MISLILQFILALFLLMMDILSIVSTLFIWYLLAKMIWVGDRGLTAP